MARKSKLSLLEWIEKNGGPHLVGPLLGVDESAVRHWRLGTILPRAETMRKIKMLSKGAVSYDEMIETHFKNKTIATHPEA